MSVELWSVEVPTAKGAKVESVQVNRKGVVVKAGPFSKRLMGMTLAQAKAYAKRNGMPFYKGRKRMV